MRSYEDPIRLCRCKRRKKCLKSRPKNKKKVNDSWEKYTRYFAIFGFKRLYKCDPGYDILYLISLNEICSVTHYFSKNNNEYQIQRR